MRRHRCEDCGDVFICGGKPVKHYDPAVKGLVCKHFGAQEKAYLCDRCEANPRKPQDGARIARRGGLYRNAYHQ